MMDRDKLALQVLEHELHCNLTKMYQANIVKDALTNWILRNAAKQVYDTVCRAVDVSEGCVLTESGAIVHLFSVSHHTLSLYGGVWWLGCNNDDVFRLSLMISLFQTLSPISCHGPPIPLTPKIASFDLSLPKPLYIGSHFPAMISTSSW
ncbi:uncharacterized protein G2W53_007856 [Senna tora]|uniref:Uncharacterized protein n=1 Tax=Senna tora TaxID=362788 RepID=A0A834X829_9FABA|nr:uncharacterized protein G2W53_007856 [Senna tora]